MILTKLKQSREMLTPAFIIVPNTIKQQGKAIKDYSNPLDKFDIFCSFKTFGGTETVNNGVIMVQDTAEVVCWYDPRITANCRLELATGALYDVIGEPENIDRANVYLKYKVQRVKGGA